MVLVKREDDCQGFLLDLTVTSLCIRECLGCIGNRTFAAIMVSVEQYRAESNF